MRRVAKALVPGLPALVLAAVALIAVAVASASPEDEAPVTSLVTEHMRAQIASLKAEVDLLKMQRDAMAASLDRVASAAAGLRAGVAQSRAQGFEAAAISGASRVTVLATIEGLARDLSNAALPGSSPQEREARRRATDLAKIWLR